MAEEKIPSDNLAVAQTLILNIARGHCNSYKMFQILQRTMETMEIQRLVHGDYAAILQDSGCVKVRRLNENSEG